MSIKKIKSYAVNTLIGIGIAALLSLIPFYFITKEVLGQHTEKINNSDKKIDKLTVKFDQLRDTIRDNELAPIVIQGEIKAMQKDVENIKENQKDMKVDLGKIYDILWEWKQQNGD